MKKCWICIVLVLLLSLQSCGQNQPIKIGFSAALSGESAGLGISLRNAFMMKVDEINELGGINGRPIEVVIKDDKNDLEIVKEVDRAFIDEGVVIIFGHDYSFKASTILEATEGEEVIVFSSTMATSEIAGLDDNFFRTTPTGDLQGQAIADHINGDFSTGLIVCDIRNQSVVESIITGYDRAYKGAYDVFEFEEDVRLKTADIIEKIEDNKYDHVFIIANPGDTIFISRLINYDYPDIHLLSASWGMNTTVGDKETFPDGVIFVADDNLESEGYVKFLADYQKKYDSEPGNAAINAYEGATVLFEGLKNADAMTYEAIKTSLLEMDYMVTATTEVRFDQYGDAKKKMFLYTSKEGKIHLVK